MDECQNFMNLMDKDRRERDDGAGDVEGNVNMMHPGKVESIHDSSDSDDDQEVVVKESHLNQEAHKESSSLMQVDESSKSVTEEKEDELSQLLSQNEAFDSGKKNHNKRNINRRPTAQSRQSEHFNSLLESKDMDADSLFREDEEILN